jgi:hypothetical protein
MGHDRHRSVVTLSPRDYDAILFDLDGVLTKTANVHASAWKRLFDGFLEQRTADIGEPFVPLTGSSRRRISCSARWNRGPATSSTSASMAAPWRRAIIISVSTRQVSRCLWPAPAAHHLRFSRQRRADGPLRHGANRRDREAHGRRDGGAVVPLHPVLDRPLPDDHNTGGAIMGTDPKMSAVNRYLQGWDVWEELVGRGAHGPFFSSDHGAHGRYPRPLG